MTENLSLWLKLNDAKIINYRDQHATTLHIFKHKYKKGNLVRFAHLCPVKAFLNVFPFIKGTVSVISSDTPCKDGIARFPTVPLKPLSYR